MRPDLLLLTALGTRRRWVRLGGIALAVAVSVALMLALWGAAAALQSREDRSAWLRLSGAVLDPDGPTPEGAALVTLSVDVHRGQAIERAFIALPEGRGPEIPAIERLPGPGEYLASPALAERIAAYPEDELGARLGQRIGILPEARLPAPGALLALVGDTPETLRASGAIAVTDFPAQGSGPSGNYQTVAIIGGIALFIPVFLLVGIVTRLGAARRAERDAVLLIIGASPRLLARLAAVEAAVPAFVGGVTGLGLVTLCRPLLALIPIDGAALFAEDIWVGWPVALLTLVLVTLLSGLAAAHRVRGTVAQPGVRGARTENAPRRLRLLPLIIGVLVMIVPLFLEFAGIGGNTRLAMVAGFVLVAVGLVVAGPVLVHAVGRFAAARAASAPALIAAERVHRHPRAVFRAVSGLVVAVFLASLFAGGASTFAEEPPPSGPPGTLPLSVLIASVADYPVPAGDNAAMDALVRELRARPDTGVVTTVGIVEGEGSSRMYLSGEDAVALGLETPGTGTVIVESAGLLSDGREPLNATPHRAEALGGTFFVFVEVLGGAGARERVRTVLETSPSVQSRGQTVPTTRGETALARGGERLESFAGMAYLGLGVAVVVAGFSLAISAAAAAVERRRVLGTLRLVGMPGRAMRRTIAGESLVPLLAVLGLSVVVGFLCAWLVLTGLTRGERTMNWPDSRYLLTLAGSAILAIGAITAPFAVLRRLSPTEAVRTE